MTDSLVEGPVFKPCRCLVVAALVVVSGGLASAQTVDELAAKSLAARGGAEKLKAIDTIQMTGHVSTQGMEVPMLLRMKRPNLVLTEMTVQGQKVVQGYDGRQAWTINPFMGSSVPQAIAGPQADMMKDQADFDGPLMDYKAKGRAVELIGAEELDGSKAYKLKVTKPGGPVQYLYLDAQTGLDLKVVTEIDQGGQKITIENLLSNYQAVNGVKMPFLIQTFVNGRPQAQITIEKIEIGVPMDDSVFRMPGGSSQSSVVSCQF